LRTGGAFGIDPTTHVQTPSPLLLVFPVAFLAGLATLVARGFAIALRWLRRRSGRFGSPLYLTVHRLAGAPGLTVLLVGASGLCLGLFVQSQTVVRSINQTVDAKAEVFVGSDVQARIEYRNTVPERMPVPFTRVTRRLQAGTLVPSRNRFGDPFDLLAIDPRTFASAAYWNSAFADRPLDELLRPLSTGSDRAVPVIVVGAPNTAPTAIAIDQIEVPVVVVGHADAFPGVSSYRPLLVVDESALLDAAGAAPNPLDEVGAQTQLWLRGDPREVEAALAAGLPYQPDLILSANEVEDIPYIAATIDTFQVMNGLGLAAALLVIVAMLMYLQARQRSQVVSYGLSLRMGMRSAGHRRALVLELGSMLGLALLAGSALAYVAARLVVPLLDPLPGIPPDPLFSVPVVAILVMVPVVAAVSLGGGWVTELRARRSDLGQVMRLAE
jgi:putative ABC transport system permease protein